MMLSTTSGQKGLFLKFCRSKGRIRSHGVQLRCDADGSLFVELSSMGSPIQPCAACAGVKASVHSFFGASLLHPDDVAPQDMLQQSRPVDGNADDLWLPLTSNRARFSGLPPIMTDFRKVPLSRVLPSILLP